MLRSSLSVERLETRDVPAVFGFADMGDQKVETEGYLEINLTDVIISSYQTAANQPTQSLSLNFVKIT